MDDTGLVDAACDGDRDAFGQLLRSHLPRMHAVAQRIVGSATDADDVVQEAAIRIGNAMRTFDRRSSFGTWSYRIVTNAALDELRRRKRHAEPTAELGDQIGRDLSGQVDDQLLVSQLLEDLPDEFREVVALRDICDLEYQEIADAMQIPIGTVRSRLARGRAVLVASLAGTSSPRPDVQGGR